MLGTLTEVDRTGRQRRLAGIFAGIGGEVFEDRPGSPFEQVQGMPQDPGLEGRVAGPAERPAKRKTDPQGAGRFDNLGMFANQTDLGGGDSFLFQVVGQPADGARAVRSDRHEHDRIDRITVQ